MTPSATYGESQHTQDVRTVANQFHMLMFGTPVRWVGQGEYRFVTTLLKEYGRERVLAVLPHAVRILRVNWPEARSIVALNPYWDDAMTMTDRAEQSKRAAAERAQRQIEQRAEEEKMAARCRLDWAREQALWDAATEEMREQMRRHIRQTFGHLAVKSDFVESMARRELVRRLDGDHEPRRRKHEAT